MKLIQNNGLPHFGHLDQPLQDANFKDYAWRTPMGRSMPRWRRHLRCNQFQFFGLTSPDLIIGCAIVNLRLLANCFFYIYEPAKDQLHEWSLLQPLALGCHTPTTPDQGRFSFKKGKSEVSMQAVGKQRHLEIDVRGQLRLQATLTEPHAFQPLRLCSRAGYDGWVYTQKANALPVTGELDFQGQKHHLSGLGGGYDWTIGFMRRETFWNWASCSTLLADGSSFGFNLAAGVNETSYTENVFWYNHHASLLAPIQFHFQRENPLEPWFIQTADQRFYAEFQPHGLRRERVQAVLLASNFRQVFGTFSGYFYDADDRKVEFGPCWGFCEDHYARW